MGKLIVNHNGQKFILPVINFQEIETLLNIPELEIYKPIKNYPNYKVSNLGNVKNITTGLILSLNSLSNGYNVVVLSKNNKQKMCSIHRLVAEAFLTNPENKKCVDHIDGNTTNNNLTNLRWATVTENAQNSKKRSDNTSGVKGITFSKYHKKWHARIYIDKIKIHIGYFETLEEAKQARIRRANEAFGIFTNTCEKLVV
jgi:hypothetical protein